MEIIISYHITFSFLFEYLNCICLVFILCFFSWERERDWETVIMYAGGGGAYSALLLMMLQETVLTSACGMPRETLYHKPTSHRANHFRKCIFIGTWEFGNIFFILPPQPAYGVVRNLMDIWLCNTCELCAVIGSTEVKMFDNSLCLLVRIQCCMSAGLQNFNCYCDITWIWCFGLGLVYTRIQARMAIRVNRLGQYIHWVWSDVRSWLYVGSSFASLCMLYIMWL